jgi:integrase
MRVFRTWYRDKEGKRRRVPHWWIEFSYHNAAGVRKICRIPGFTDKGASNHLGTEVERIVTLREASSTLDARARQVISTMAPPIRKKLLAIGILDPATVSEQLPLLAHLEGEFDANNKLKTPGYIHKLKADNRSEQYIGQVVSHVKRIVDECNYTFWTDVTATKTEHYLTGLRGGDQGIKHRTYNDYVQSICGFANWAVKTGRIPYSPLASLQKITITDAEERRALSLEETRLLLAWVETSEPWRKISGPDRAMIYRFAVETGLRRGEIESLTRASFDLDDERPCVNVATASTKNRRGATIDLSKQMVVMLKTYLANKMPTAQAFPIPPEDTADMLRSDLAGTRKAWIEAAETTKERKEREKSDILLNVNHAGQTLVFHSTRHTRGVWLFEHYKASPREVQDLMRLSSIALVDRYSRSFKIRDTTLVDRGPDLSLPKTGAALAGATS